MSSITQSVVEDIVGTGIRNLSLYQQALTHKSHSPEGNYETLEFMGDSVLGFVVTKYLYDKYREKQEGFLTKVRTKLVRGTTLAKVARGWDLGKWVVMDEKGMRNGWNHNDKILEDVLEALVGALYLDLGMVHAKRFVLDFIQNRVDWKDVMFDDNWKDQLMRFCQANYKCLPTYVHPDSEDAGAFVAMVEIQGRRYKSGKGSTKKAAEQVAARKTLDIIRRNVQSS